MLEYGATPDVSMSDGSTPLHWAAFGGHIEIISDLLAHNANPNIINSEGLSAFDLALKHGHEDAATLLEKAMIANRA